MLPAIKHVASDTFVFQQDNAPSHHAKDTIKLLQQETPDFTDPDLWLPSSPDLNPVDYKVWVLCSRERMNVVSSSLKSRTVCSKT